MKFKKNSKREREKEKGRSIPPLPQNLFSH